MAVRVTAYPVRPAVASSAEVKPVEAGHDEASERVANAEMRDSTHRAESGLPPGIEYRSARSPVSGDASNEVRTPPLASVAGGRNSVRPDGAAQIMELPSVANSSTAVSVISGNP